MPTTACVPEIGLDRHPTKPLHVRFDAPQTSSDRGLLLVRQADDALAVCDRLAAAVPDVRDPRWVVHPRREQVAVRTVLRR